MRILITGVNGFVGGYLAKYLISQGEDVAGIHRTEDKSAKVGKLKLFEADLKDFKATSAIIKKYKPDVIYHLAAFSSVSESFKKPLETIENNIGIEFNILESAKMLKEKPKVIIISSSDVYGKVAKKNNPIKEETPLQPLSPYSLSKAAQEFMGLQYFHVHEIPVVCLRPFLHVGPGQNENFVVSSFAKKIVEAELSSSKNPVISVGNLSAVRDFTDVRDMVRAYYLALVKAKIGNTYNVGSGNGISISDLLEKMLAMSPKSIKVRQDKGLFRPVDIPMAIADSTSFMKTTGWKTHIPLEDTIFDMLQFWRKELSK
jgi:GDP-4-dehydro-6-deoxy-D-mannose reductase